MKKTKSMVYKPTVESDELVMYATNNGDLYRSRIKPVIDCLRKKAIRGTYDREKAIYLWYSVACDASNRYNRDFGYRFSVQERFTAAVDLEEHYKEDHVFSGLEG